MKSLKARETEREARKTLALKVAKASGNVPNTEAAPAEEGEEAEEEGAEGYETWTVADLKAELAARNLSATGNKAELVAALEENDG